MVKFAQAQGCHLFDVVSPGEAAGICHVLLPEQGFIRWFGENKRIFG